MILALKDILPSIFGTSTPSKSLSTTNPLILSPAFADDALKKELEAHYSSQQIAEICLDVVKWSQQKALVALRTEAPPWDTTNVLTFDEQGNPGFGGPAYD